MTPNSTMMKEDEAHPSSRAARSASTRQQGRPKRSGEEGPEDEQTDPARAYTLLNGPCVNNLCRLALVWADLPALAYADPRAIRSRGSCDASRSEWPNESLAQTFRGVRADSRDKPRPIIADTRVRTGHGRCAQPPNVLFVFMT